MELPKGFSFAGVSCGLKRTGNDLGLIVAENDCVASGVYTKNIIRAACIDFDREITPTEKCRAVVVNSGNANACTGEQGKTNCLQTAQWVANELGCDGDQILVLSTGVIGEQLPIEKIEWGIRKAHSQLEPSAAAFESLTDAFMTTDRYRKSKSCVLSGAGDTVRIAGIAKGAGMIGPNMATMLCAIVTDAALTAEQSQNALNKAVAHSFNRISVDGHTSTNDAVVLLSSGVPSETNTLDQPRFQNHLNDICLELAKMIPADGEGSAHLIEIHVTGAESDLAADQIARTIAMSNLVKTAISGCDPNWGRIVSAAGYAGVAIQPAMMHLKINGIEVYKNGEPAIFDESQVSDLLAKSGDASIELNVGIGAHRATHWTSDLTTDYVVLNSEYRT